MFGWTKKKPSLKANRNLAIDLAYGELLQSKIARTEIERTANAVIDTYISYSTHEVALSIALFFFRRPELNSILKDAQLFARMQMLSWLENNEINPLLASTFENSLYELYAPKLDLKVNQPSAATPNKNSRKEIERSIRAFFTRQHNTASANISGLGLELDFDKYAQECAFLVGALFSTNLSTPDKELIFKGIIFSGFPDEAEQLLSMQSEFLSNGKYQYISQVGGQAYQIYQSSPTPPEDYEDLLFSLDFSAELEEYCSIVTHLPDDIKNVFAEILDAGESLKSSAMYGAWLIQLAHLIDGLDLFVEDPSEDIRDSLDRLKRFLFSPYCESIIDESLLNKLNNSVETLILLTEPKLLTGYPEQADVEECFKKDDPPKKQMTFEEVAAGLRHIAINEKDALGHQDTIDVIVYVAETSAAVLSSDINFLKKELEKTKAHDAEFLVDFRSDTLAIYELVMAIRRRIYKSTSRR